MTNPGDIVRVRARRGGRASIYEANAWCQGYTEGLLDGTGVVPNTVADLNVLVGGTPTRPDVVLAKNPAGYRIALDLVGQQVIALTTPAANKRISSIVAYTDDLALSTTQNDVTGSPESCGLIVVNGAASAEPVAPTDSEIRAAITADGAAGSQACYGVIANITVSSDTTTITKTLIDIAKATLSFKLTSDNVDSMTFKVNPKYIQTGSGSLHVQPNGSGGGEVKVTFPIKFDTTPDIFLSLDYYGTVTGTINVTSRTPSDFKANARHSYTSTETKGFSWVAIDASQPPFIPDNQ